MEIEDIIEQGDLLAVRWKATGTQQGTFLGVASTGKFVTTTGMGFYRMQNKKVAEVFIQWDVLRLLHELNIELPIKLEIEALV